MKKIITFEKNLEFPSMIGEITSISLDEQLKFKDSSVIEGKLIVKGTYKRTEASRLEEEFKFDLPTEIILTEKLDLDSSKIDIDDFYYKVESDDTISCHISILVEGIEIVDFEEPEDVLENHEKIIEKIQNIEEDDIKEMESEAEIIEDLEELRECDGDISYDKSTLDEKKDDNSNVNGELLEDNKIATLIPPTNKEIIKKENILPKIENIPSNEIFAVDGRVDNEVYKNDNNGVIEKLENHEVVEKIQKDENKDNNINTNVIEKEKDANMNIKEKESNIVVNNSSNNVNNNTNSNTNITVNEDNVGSLFTLLKDSEETFSTYAVYIVRGEETVESILEKYKITKEELENYNEISTITVGSKVIIPLKNE